MTIAADCSAYRALPAFCGALPIYPPAAFAVDDDEALAMLEQTPFGALVSLSEDRLIATQIPFLIDRDPLRLVGHLARNNPHGQVRQSGGEAMMIVQTSSAYISPGFYPSKVEHGRVVPTWNYEAVHVHGVIEWFDDPARLRNVIEGLTDRFERDRAEPWAVSDAPTAYVDGMLGAIIGVAFRVTRIQGLRKLSQNRNAADHAGVVAGLSASSLDSDRAVAKAMKP